MSVASEMSYLLIDLGLKTLEYVYKSSGIERTRALARVYAHKARDTLHFLPESDAKLGLSALAMAVVD